jgi:hypothetical protein
MRRRRPRGALNNEVILLRAAAGVDPAVIYRPTAHHESVEIPVRIYLEATLAMKELGLAKSSPSYGRPGRYAPGICR